MKRLIYLTLSLILALTSCSKEVKLEILSEETPSALVPMSFNTVLPDTRTTADGVHILWSGTDKLNIIEVDGENRITEHTFTCQSGGGTASAVFSGEVNSPDNTFYAVYPDQKLYNSPTTMSGTTIELKTLGQSAAAVENGFDPAMAVMTAVADADGKLAFRHAMAYLKFTANSAALASVKVTSSGDARIYGRPIINIGDGSPSGVNGTSSGSNVTLSGSFVSGSSYMIPITVKPGKKLGTLTFLATDENGVTSEISTTGLSNVKPEAGHVYNLGTIPFSFAPSITFTAPGKLEYDATSGSFPYAVSNPVSGQSVTATLESGVDWISNIAVGADAVTFDCTKNDAADAQERSAVITLHYTGAADVPVTVTQKVNGGSATGETHVRIYYNKTVELYDGVEVTADYYFAHSTSYVALATGTDGGNIASFEIPGTSLTATSGLKLDGSGYCRFTTSSTLNSSVTFYYVKRKSGTGKIQITPTGGTATVYDDVVFGTVKNQTVALEKNTEYTIARNNGELLLVAVVVNESAD